MVLFGRKVRLQLVPTIAYLLLLPILLALANWQYDRAQQKQQLLAAIEKNSAAESIYIDDLASIAMPKSRYKKIQLTGKYDQQHQFLLDNQIHEGKAGYFVITPLILARFCCTRRNIKPRLLLTSLTRQTISALKARIILIICGAFLRKRIIGIS